jgi:predicted PurR-regulated permease PerM
MVILRQNAQQIFTNLNRFISAFVFPVMFIVFTSIGSSLHRSIEQFFMRAEGKEDGTYSKILNEYSMLLMEYITVNLIYYLLLSVVVGSSLAMLDAYGITSFGWKLIVGVLVSFITGNLVIPGLGTFVMTALVVGILFAETGWFIAGLFLAIFGTYILLDDYIIKPFFLVWMGGSPGRNWEFGVEIIIFGLVILYSAFGLIGVLLLFPALCFLSAYLRDQYPELRPWILQPIQHLRQ